MNYKNIISKVDHRLFNTIPIIYQTESSECGLACLAMICHFYGKHTSLSQLREDFGSARGINLVDLKKVASKLGLNTRVLSLDIENLYQVKKPCLMHWNFNHFVVLVKTKKNKFIIHDPYKGRVSINYQDMSNSFTGIVAELIPKTNFKKETISDKMNILSIVKNISGIKSSLFKLMSLSIVIEVINLLTPIATQLAMDNVIPSKDIGLLNIIIISLILFTFLNIFIKAIRSWSSLILENFIDVQWQSGLFEHLIKLPLSFFEKRKLGDIQSRFESLEILREIFTSSIITIIMDSIMIFIVLNMLIMYSLKLTLIVLLFSFIYIFVKTITYSQYMQISKDYLIKDAICKSNFMESLHGISTLKMQNMIEQRISNWIDLRVDSINSKIKQTKINIILNSANSLIYSIEQIIILWLGISLILNDNITIGMFVAFGLFREQFSQRITSLVNNLFKLCMIHIHNERVSDISLQKKNIELKSKYNLKSEINLSIEMKNINYRYDNNSEYILSNINLNILNGECVAIVGKSGSGKTTLLKLMSGLLEPTNGEILINNIEMKHIGINNYLELIGGVMQDDKLFSGSIKQNICGFSSETNTDLMIESAIMSNIHNFIISLPMGYETLIGELGEGLSGGQKQRIFIARALYKRPKILFMDEATSALDINNEKYINESIKNSNITRIIIAHRESTIRSADRIITI
ncbi:peptidase domain-containing ABC transporter [Photobacterium damselae]|uniref:peptidase domain-containing ABC transporter n=1 Tax=Photobacterium damselae TaxID=38293 RepID=UPI00083B2459|nr:peptidase domain-containing ABC transporter [Photobacterium damselae]KAB1175039.1 peptidase domain-containing ABC transporter [Photobacterium damselae subsp. damselae]NVO75319.1 peptidase domain-containing ABC transporter [Photobacterium damselae subsp. damselae]